MAAQRALRLAPKGSPGHTGPHCARPACSNLLPHRSGVGKPKLYCSSGCQRATKSEYATSVRQLNSSLDATLEFHRGVPQDFAARLLRFIAGDELHRSHAPVDKSPQRDLLVEALRDLLHAFDGSRP